MLAWQPDGLLVVSLLYVSVFWFKFEAARNLYCVAACLGALMPGFRVIWRCAFLRCYVRFTLKF